MSPTGHILQQRPDTYEIPPEGFVHRRPGDPEPFTQGSPEALELDRLIEELRPPETASDLGVVPDSLYGDMKEDSGHVDDCPRAVRRLIADGDSTVAVWAPCSSRTCGNCKPAVDERDAARISHSLGAGTIYRATVPSSSWERIRKRAQRSGAVAVKMASAEAANLIEVISSEPVTATAQRLEAKELIDLVERRPSWAPGRAQTSGPGLVSVREWEERTTPAKPEQPSIEMHHSVTVDDVELYAEALKIPTRREGPYSLRLGLGWDTRKMRALRILVQDPTGQLEWESMLFETEVARGERSAEEPPIESYEEAA